MAGVINTTYTFTATDLVTSTKLNNLIDETVFTEDAIEGSTLDVTAAFKLKVATGGITSNEIAANAVVTAGILDGQVTAGKLATDAVETLKIKDANVTAAKLATDAVETAKIKNANVTAAKLDGGQTAGAPIYGARAWVRFNGNKNVAGTAILDVSYRQLLSTGGNVASVLRNGVGDYTVTFTTALPSENYVAVGQRAWESGNTGNVAIQGYSTYPQTAAAFRFIAYSDGGSADSADIQLVFFG